MKREVSSQEGLNLAFEELSTFVWQIRLESLPFYLQAAQRTGFRIKEIAQVGEILKTHRATNITVMKGFIGIAITMPRGVKDHSTFRDELNSNPNYQELMNKPLPSRLRK